MDFKLSDAQKQIVDTIDEMGRKEFAPRASRWDENHEYPWDNVHLLRDANILGMTIPTEYGGQGRPLIDAVLAIETAAKYCGVTARIIVETNMGALGLRGIPITDLVAATNEVMYPKFCELLGLTELIDDPRFNTNAKRVVNRDEIMPLFEEKMRAKTRDEWLQVFEEAKLPCGPILNFNEVFADKNVLERDMLFTQEHPIEGVIKQLGFPFKFSQTPAEAKLRPPLLGEHNEEILKYLNYSDREIERFREEKVI